MNGSRVSTLGVKIVRLPYCDLHVLSQRSCIAANIPLKFILALAHQSRYRRTGYQNPIKWHRRDRINSSSGETAWLPDMATELHNTAPTVSV